MRMARSRLAPALAATILWLGSAPPVAFACSICRCGDPTFNALGRGFAAGGFRGALDWERFDKDEGDPALASESQVENRFTVLYVTPRLLVDLGHGLVLRAGAQIPLVRALNGYQTERVVANVGLTWLLSR
jgi:hypothetical protein